MWGFIIGFFLDFNSWIFDKTFRSKVMAWKSQYANEYILAATSHGADAATFHQTGPSLVLSKSNGRLQVTWSSKATSY